MELVTLTTADDVELDGAIYLPPDDVRTARPPVFAIHGLTWNFYRGPMRWLPPLLVTHGYPCLALNMRDHDLDVPKDFERSHHDLRAGIDYLADRFGQTPIVIGHGYANNKIISYAAQSGDDRIDRTVLATLGSVRKYRPDIWDAVLRDAHSMRGDALVVQGAVDELIEAVPRAAEFVAAAQGCRVDVVHLAGGNHYFHDTEHELADAILDWLGDNRTQGDAQ
jgi:hypothetical protein